MGLRNFFFLISHILKNQDPSSTIKSPQLIYIFSEYFQVLAKYQFLRKRILLISIDASAFVQLIPLSIPSQYDNLVLVMDLINQSSAKNFCLYEFKEYCAPLFVLLINSISFQDIKSISEFKKYVKMLSQHVSYASIDFFLIYYFCNENLNVVCVWWNLNKMNEFKTKTYVIRFPSN